MLVSIYFLFSIVFYFIFLSFVVAFGIVCNIEACI